MDSRIAFPGVVSCFNDELSVGRDAEWLPDQFKAYTSDPDPVTANVETNVWENSPEGLIFDSAGHKFGV